MTKDIVVLGAGFAGLWTVIGAMRKIVEAKAQDEIKVAAVNRTPYHNIRVRNYEADLREVCVPLEDVLAPIGVDIVLGEATDIDLARRTVTVASPAGARVLNYDRLALATGSAIARPPIPGLAEFGFDVDTYESAAKLDAHLKALARRPAASGRYSVVVIGAGLTGIETATAMPARLAAIRANAPSAEPMRIIVVDRQPFVGSDMGAFARPAIEEALARLGIEQRVGAEVERIEASGAQLTSGEWIDAMTVIWCGGMRASPLAGKMPGAHDARGRVAVDEYLRVAGVKGVYAAGDVASLLIDGAHASVMSCQHGRPMGRFAGHNIAADLLGAPLLPLRIDWYTTILDLGPADAVYTAGWDRRVIASGAAAKATKRTINGKRIYPPRSRNAAEILAAAAPTVQKPPEIGGGI
ncbi:MAG TPA: FAD-dependent oxidoreductase [Roseiarcus sp.]|nr:FAD-dependent oxidoreductase [Roseiarcus sp.]